MVRPLDRFGGRVDRGQIDDTAFGFGNDFVFHDQDIARLELDAASAQGFEKFFAEGVPGLDFIFESNGDEAELFRLDGLPFLSPLRC